MRDAPVLTPAWQYLRMAMVWFVGIGTAVVLANTSYDREASPTAQSVRSFGAPITLVAATPLSQVLDAPERHTDEPLLVTGTIAEVCQRRGCWTILRDGEASVRVRFQDYGFFVPKDCQGQTAWIEGRAQVRTLTEDEARHLASETPGEDPASVHGPRREVGFVATGVRLAEG